MQAYAISEACNTHVWSTSVLDTSPSRYCPLIRSSLPVEPQCQRAFDEAAPL